jgi:hypothetical protein
VIVAAKREHDGYKQTLVRSVPSIVAHPVQKQHASAHCLAIGRRSLDLGKRKTRDYRKGFGVEVSQGWWRRVSRAGVAYTRRPMQRIDAAAALDIGRCEYRFAGFENHELEKTSRGARVLRLALNHGPKQSAQNRRPNDSVEQMIATIE